MVGLKRMNPKVYGAAPVHVSHDAITKVPLGKVAGCVLEDGKTDGGEAAAIVQDPAPKEAPEELVNERPSKCAKFSPGCEFLFEDCLREILCKVQKEDRLDVLEKGICDFQEATLKRKQELIEVKLKADRLEVCKKELLVSLDGFDADALLAMRNETDAAVLAARAMRDDTAALLSEIEEQVNVKAKIEEEGKLLREQVEDQKNAAKDAEKDADEMIAKASSLRLETRAGLAQFNAHRKIAKALDASEKDVEELHALVAVGEEAKADFQELSRNFVAKIRAILDDLALELAN